MERIGTGHGEEGKMEKALCNSIAFIWIWRMRWKAPAHKNRKAVANLVQALIVSPTRELAGQTEKVILAIKLLVLDEYDEMLRTGFKDQIYDVYRYLPPELQ
ncbi:hypothetical protein KI387_021887, partial [Taxus chinensis]